MPLTALPDATRQRIADLDAYYQAEVLSGTGEFACRSASACETSALGRPRVGFYPAQGISVGDAYDLREDGSTLRVLVVAMESGQPRSHVTVAQRSAEVQLLVEAPWKRWNQHMRGVAFALQLAFGQQPSTSDEARWLSVDGKPTHVLHAYAMTNLLLCSAVNIGTKASRSTPVMRRNCLRHLRPPSPSSNRPSSFPRASP
jgi:hypothetical protein